MTGTTFNVFLGGTSEKLSENDYEISMVLTGLLKADPTQKEYVDYVFYSGVDTVGDRHRFPVTPDSPVLGKTGEQLLGEGSDNILNSVGSLIGGIVEPARLVGMVTDQKNHPLKETPVNLRALSPGGVQALQQNLAKAHEITPDEQQKVNDLIAAIRAKTIKQVNLIGWSRGGYNAIRIANHLHIHYPHIHVNILAFDPVPGPLNHTHDTLKLPPNVKNYASLIALNEYRLGFIPVIPAAEKPQQTRRLIKTVPGNHSAMMGDRQRDVTQGDPISYLSNRSLRFAIETLYEWGAIKDDIKSDTKIASDWQQVQQNLNTYQHMNSHTNGLGIIQVHNYSTTHGPEGDVRSRLVHDKKLGYRYLSDIPGLQFNQPDLFQGHFGLVPDTCVLHRDYNDEIIANNIGYFISIHSDSLEKLYKLQLDLQARHQCRGKDEVFTAAIELMDATARKQNSIFFAASLDDVSKIDEYPNDLNATIGEGDTPLMIAARKGNERFIQELIKRKVDFNLKNKSDETALAVAARYGQIGVLNRLLKYYSIKEQIDALIIAARYNQKLVVKNLDAAVNHSNPLLLGHSGIRYLLMWTIENDDLELLSSLLTNSHVLVNIDLKAGKQTLLSYATLFDRKEMICKIESCEAMCKNTQSMTSKPCITSRGVLVGGFMVGSLGYSSAVLAASVHSLSTTVNYSSLTETLFVASRLNAPPAITAIVLTSLVVLAGLCVIAQTSSNEQTRKPSATLR